MRSIEFYMVVIRRLAVLLLPTMLRSKGLTAVVQILAAPFAYMQVQMVNYRTEKEKRLKHNGQVCKLRAMLNDMFDADQRGILIADAEVLPDFVIFQRRSGLIKSLPVDVPRRGFSGSMGYDFVVKVPLRLYSDAMRMKIGAAVTEYKLASKRFVITKSE